MSTDLRADIRASRFRVARSRGALSGLLLLVLGLWAAIVPFIGPYFDFAFTPAPNSAWHWSSARLYLEVLPGAAAFLGGLLLLVSASRLTTSFGAWLGVAGGAWLVVGPVLADPIGIHLGTPDPSSGRTVQALEQLFFFFAIGAAIVFVAALALGRLSVHSIRDVRAAQRRTAAEEAAAAEAAEAERREQERRAAEQRDTDAQANEARANETAGHDQGQSQQAYPQHQAYQQQAYQQQAYQQQPADQPQQAGDGTWMPQPGDQGAHNPQHSAPPPEQRG